MAFDCTIAGVRIEDSMRLSRDAIAAAGREHGLTSVYVIAAVEVEPRRWRRGVVDVVLHLADGDDVLGAQFPDEAKAAVLAAAAAIISQQSATSSR